MRIARVCINIIMYDTLVLSGNSTNAVAILGALQYLYDDGRLGDELVNLIGTSSGAIVALLLCVGYAPIDVIAYLCVEKTYENVARFNVGNLLLLGRGLIDFAPIERCVETLLVDKIGFVPTLDELRERYGKRLTCVTYDMTTDTREYITCDTHPTLSTLSAVRMSSTFPFVFAPYEHDGHFYIDGGIVDNFAIERGLRVSAATRSADARCLGVYIRNGSVPYVVADNLSLFQRLIDLFVRVSTEDKIARATERRAGDASAPCEIIALDFPSSFFNFNSTTAEILRMFDNGYAMCKRQRRAAAMIGDSADPRPRAK
jgi:predicted patatin/cPLA2 family phospholipase